MIPVEARNQVDMEVHERLTGGWSVVDADIECVGLEFREHLRARTVKEVEEVVTL